MTAIVGPNGSGKSNILDSLRWVLGDSHSSKLRIAKQDGLIFHGSASRERGVEASVSVQLREGTKVCTIRRRVSAEAGAAVTVDGVRVTLAELDETKREWQLGGDKFAFIGQGEVAEVIQQRPQARRALLESLFGIDAYRKRREDASGRLGQAREEYMRLRTFSAELKARYDEIAPEVTRARAAREMLDALEEYRKIYYWVRRAAGERALAALKEEKRRIGDASRLRRMWISGWERSLRRIDEEITELSNSRQLQIRESDAAKNTLAGFTKTAYGYGAALTSAARRAAQIKEERVELEGRLAELKTEGEKHAASEKARKDELASGRKSLAEASELYRQYEERTREARERLERMNRERGEIGGEMSALRGRIASIGASLRSSGREAAPPGPDPLKEIKRELDRLEARHGELLDEQEHAASRYRDVYAKLQGTSSDLQRNRREYSKLSGRLSELQEHAAAEVYPQPVQHVMSAARLGRIKANLRVVIDSFECPQEFAVAMEASLGGRQFWILADTMDEVGVCIELLKKNQMGRATLLPLERCRPRSGDFSRRLPASGIVGWAMELIKPDGHWRPALEHMIGDLLIVEDYKVGQSLVRDGFRGPVTTLEGDVFQPGGSISGGRSKKPGKAMEIMSAIARLEAETAAARKLVDSLSADFSRLEEEEAAAAARRDAVSLEIRELAAGRSACDERRESIIRERARAKNERESLLSSLKECGRAYAALTERKAALDAENGGEMPAPETDLRMMKEIERLKSRVALAEEKLRSGFVLSERMAAEIKSAAKSIADIDEEFSSCERDVLANRSNLASLARRYAEVARSRRNAAREMAGFKERYDAIDNRRKKRTARLETARAAMASGSAALSAADLREAELSRECSEIIQTWEEQYPYPGPESVGDDNPDELRRSMRECDRNIRMMGDVDMGVLSEERSLRDRLAFLGEQLDDVGNGIRELERLIAEADEQARVIFTGAMEEIDKKFNALFQQLFNGGDAKLELMEGDSLWDSGVDVVARPPGKHPASIAQLSGGEQSLSAIALLFASLEVASCPIAVLDEVDAALDEVNLRRFADLTRDSARERQIFVMTHRRLTMERAGALYGVTLAEPGRSQVIGVRIEDWS
jgi:chromosome segregation protein